MMDIQVTWFSDQFNVGIASKEGAEPFLSIKGARIVDGSKGPFVSWPATKNQTTQKYWNHVWANDKFNAAVLEKAQQAMPASKGAAGAQKPNKNEEDSDCPF
jgi:DNA-binding cell septation regulator SpoVG